MTMGRSRRDWARWLRGGPGRCTPGTPRAGIRTPERKRTGSGVEAKRAVGTPKQQFRHLTKGDAKLTRQPSRPGEADPELPRTPRLGRNYRASRIQRSWKLWRFRRAFERYSIDYVGYLASLNWLRKHNMLYGIELADSTDTKHWYAMHGAALQDRDVDPWGHERLREHLDRIWSRELEARKRAACPIRQLQSPMVTRMKTTPVRKPCGGNAARPMVMVGKAQLSPTRQQLSRVAHSLPPAALRGQEQQLPPKSVPVQEGRPLFMQAQMAMPRFELGTNFSFPHITTMLPRMTGAPPPPPPPIASAVSGGPAVAEGARLRSVSLNPSSLLYPMPQMAPRLAQPPLLMNQVAGRLLELALSMVAVAKNAPNLRIQPAWIQHDKQVLRYYAYFQEPVVESPTENFRIRKCTILYYLEDGSLQISEPKIINSGMQQGSFLKRHRVEHPDGGGYYGPENLRCGITITVYGRVFKVTGCDKFTKDFYSQHGLDIGEECETPVDQYTAGKCKSAEEAQKPIPEAVREQKVYNEMILGGGRTNPKMKQYLENDRKVLRFYAYWDDKTRYGTRQYYTIHFFLVDDTLEILETHTRNSGRDRYPTFYKRAPLLKKPIPVHTPGMFVDEMQEAYDETGGKMQYSPYDLSTGASLSVYGRDFFIYDCDSGTREFYKKFNGNPQEAVELDVEPPTHYELTKPPHIGIGLEEDSIGSCYSLRPKPPRQDMVKKMLNSGRILRFEARMANNQPEDENRRFIIGVYLADDQVAVWEMKCRNSGQTEGKFSEKSRKRNPATGKWSDLCGLPDSPVATRFSPSEFYVGATVTIVAVPFYIVRADEYSLKYMEQQGSAAGFHYSDMSTIAKKLAPLESCPEFVSRESIDPDQFNEIVAKCTGERLVDQEVISVIRSCGDLSSEPCEIEVPKVVEAIQQQGRFLLMSSPSSSSPPSSPTSSSSSSSPSSPTAAVSKASPGSAFAKDFVDDEAGSSSPGGSPGHENDLFGAEDPHEEAPNSEDELMDEIEAEKERAPSPLEEPTNSPPEDRTAPREHAQHRPVRGMTVQPSFCPGANTLQGIEATDGNNGINKILLCWNSYGIVTRQMLTPPDVVLPDDEVPESAIETTYTTPGAPSRIHRLKDSVYGWSMASISDKGVVLGAPCSATESSEEDVYDEDDFVTDAKPSGGEASQNVARVHFRPSATYRPGISNSGPRDWTATIPLGEQLITVAIGRDFIAALTFCRKVGAQVRIWSLNAGLPTNVITVGGPTSRPVSLAASPLSGVILWAVAEDGGDATKIRYSLVRTAGSGSRVGLLAEGPLPVSGDVHHHAGQGPMLTWIGMTAESIPLSMDSVGVMRALVPMGVTVGCPSTQLKWMPVYDCMAELQRENEGFWAIGGTGWPSTALHGTDPSVLQASLYTCAELGTKMPTSLEAWRCPGSYPR
ncbi:EF-hand domain (C-terminal) containing [Perkinsus chesapeaki]|uniref:EF-hand domain (C-terminal) containing n=1 Tax=Perkinsus chesapeaki TaxID=330153 RepID=A0A7J6N267_PERCH|nr:EF-hand domain (C-terminal) containing [Perkinsus chesapeaki]